MGTLDLGKPADNAAQFLVYRAEAIGAYANLEQSLAMLLSVLLGSDAESAAIIFFRITNAKSRGQIIEALLEKRFGSKFDHFWFGIPNTGKKRGLKTILNSLDGDRNNIVHWHIRNQINVDTGSSRISLGPPNFWSQKNATPITETELSAFIDKCDFASRSLNMFCAHHGNFQNPIPLDDAWRDIYQQPCVYPPLSTHPLYKSP